jgi:uncharacterized repeat protein (TIGR02543 family)
VTSPSGISCGTVCSANFVGGSNVNLTASPAPGYTFIGWSGVCAGTSVNCSVTMNANNTATAMFIATNAASGTPVLFFTDLVNSPRTGNSDTSHGQAAGQDGAIVTVWGKNLGRAQGSSAITVGGVAARVYYWGDATHGANLTARMGMQMIEFQIPGTAPLGSAAIKVSVNNVDSNTLPFVTRDQGRIYFVAPTTSGGSDTNPGSWTSPWATFEKVATTIANGDVVYFRDGFVDDTPQFDGGCIALNTDGAPDMPKAIVAYPGALATVGGSCGGISNYSFNLNRGTAYWLVSKLKIVSTGITDGLLDLGNGFRAVGNSISNPHTSDSCQSGTIQCGGLGPCGSNIFVLGNEVADVMRDNAATGSKQCHTIYISGDRQNDGVESNREIAWNYIHDCFDNRAINIYNESFNGATSPRVQIEGHRVHDNWIENHRGVGILIGADVTGDNWVYNNVLINTGTGPDWSEGLSGHSPMELRPGSAYNTARATALYVYHNTIYGTGFASNPGLISYYPTGATNFEFKNNIVVSTLSGIPYVASWSAPIPAGSYHNLWYGAGSAPAWDTGAINSDPLFVDAASANFHLQATSSARDNGLSLSGVALDFDGTSRPQGPGADIGAYEYIP